MSPAFTSALDIFCLSLFAFFRWFKTTWGIQKPRDRLRNAIFAVLFLISLTIFILSAFEITSPFLGDILRPFVVLIFFRTIRFNCKEFYYDLQASFTILVTLFVWIFYYTMFGFYLFRYTFEGTVNFVNL